MDNCYQPDPENNSEALRAEFDPPAFDAWLRRLSDRGLLQILVAVMLKLERLARAPLDGPRREAVMRRMVSVARDLADDLPRGTYGGGGVAACGGRPLSLEQRLICLIVKNLKRTLEVLDRSGGGGISQRESARRWVLQELFANLGRQIELGVLWGKPWPHQTWAELHELHAYCRARLGGGPERAFVANGGFDPEVAYKRLLLMGLIAEEQATVLLAPEQRRRFADWVEAAELNDPGAYFGAVGACIVECARDVPPRRVSGALGAIERAWVLDLPSALAAELAAIKTERDRRGFAVE